MSETGYWNTLKGRFKAAGWYAKRQENRSSGGEPDLRYLAPNGIGGLIELKVLPARAPAREGISMTDHVFRDDQVLDLWQYAACGLKNRPEPIGRAWVLVRVGQGRYAEEWLFRVPSVLTEARKLNSGALLMSDHPGLILKTGKEPFSKLLSALSS